MNQYIDVYVQGENKANIHSVTCSAGCTASIVEVFQLVKFSQFLKLALYSLHNG